MKAKTIYISLVKLVVIAFLTALAPGLYAQNADTTKLNVLETDTVVEELNTPLPTALKSAFDSEANYQLLNPNSTLSLPISRISPMISRSGEALDFDINAKYRTNTAKLIEQIGVGENNFVARPPITPTLHGTDFNNYGVLFELPRGAITGYGSQRTMVALGAINRAGVGYTHNFNPRLSMSAGAGVSQFSSPFARRTSFDVSGSARYQLNDRVGFRAFGSYSTTQLMPTLSSAEYGATVAYKFSDTFTMEVGARNVYDSYAGRWQVIPVAIPHVTIGGVTVGLDVGGLVYELVRSFAMPNAGPMMQGVGGAPPPTQRPPGR